MAKGDASKSVPLSEELVQDSSDEETGGKSTDHDVDMIDAEASEEGNKSGSDGTDSGSDTDSSSGSTGSSDSTSRKRQRETTSKETRGLAKRQKRTTVRVPPKPFKAPTGFELLKRSISSQDKEISSAFEALDGKQVWHITAPASLDLSEIQKFDVEAVLAGGPILTTGGIRYGMHPISENTESLLLPHGDSVMYKSSKSKIARSFQLQEIAKLPNDMSINARVLDEDLTNTNDAQPSQRSANGDAVEAVPNPKAGESAEKKRGRKQPEGKLNYRYVPFGVKVDLSKGIPGVRLQEPVLMSADSQDNEASAVPSTPNKKEKKKKRKSKLTDEPSI